MCASGTPLGSPIVQRMFRTRSQELVKSEREVYRVMHVMILPARVHIQRHNTLNDLETMPACDSTGMLVAGGGTVQVTLKNTGNGVNRAPSRAYIVCHSDAVLELKDQSSIVYS